MDLSISLQLTEGPGPTAETAAWPRSLSAMLNPRPHPRPLELELIFKQDPQGIYMQSLKNTGLYHNNTNN